MAGLTEFYPFYLSHHTDRTRRRLHFIGTTTGILAGYAFAWVGHFFYMLTGKIPF
jgi:hypothetical protein